MIVFFAHNALLKFSKKQFSRNVPIIPNTLPIILKLNQSETNDMRCNVTLNHVLEVKGLYQLNDPLPVHNIYHVTEVILQISSYLCALKFSK